MTFPALSRFAARISPSPVPRKLAVPLWTTVVILSTIAIVAIWPEPYVFRVSQLTFDAVEVTDGKLAPLDDFTIGYERLAAFQRRRNSVVLFSATIGASAVHLVASLLRFSKLPVLIDLLAAIGALVGFWISDAALPPFVDPVYGPNGFDIGIPWWIKMIGWMLFTLVLAGVSLLVRSILGKIVRNRSRIGATDCPNN